MADSKITVKPRETSRRGRSMWGMQRTLVNNLVKGVKDGFTEELEINGVGLRAAMQGKNLQLNMGFSHDVIYPLPAGIEIKVEKPTSIKISGAEDRKSGVKGQGVSVRVELGGRRSIKKKKKQK